MQMVPSASYTAAGWYAMHCAAVQRLEIGCRIAAGFEYAVAHGSVLGAPRMSPLMTFPMRPIGWPTTAKSTPPSSAVQGLYP